MPATSPEQLLDLYTSGEKNRHVRKTSMNDSSSRSHLIFGINIVATHLQNGNVTYGKLSLVDLAGSERQKKTQITDEIGMKEAQSINGSLSALGNVINALSVKKGHVPYRDNHLTMLLSDSLGGTAKTLMFVCISPADYNFEESHNSLVYGERAKNIVNKVEVAKDTKEGSKMRKENKTLLKKMEEVMGHDQLEAWLVEVGLSTNIPQDTQQGSTEEEKTTPRVDENSDDEKQEKGEKQDKKKVRRESKKK